MNGVSHLRREFNRIGREPIPYIKTAPEGSNLLSWRYVIQGPPDTPYEGGIYQGKVVFPSDFPFSPPSIYMLTPNGRFKTQTKLCLSMSDFHPKTWSPSWNVSAILMGILSFMLEDTPTVGSVETSYEQKRKYAHASHAFNLADKVFLETFPELAEDIRSGAVPPVDLKKKVPSSRMSARQSDIPQHLSAPLVFLAGVVVVLLLALSKYLDPHQAPSQQ